MKALRIGFMVAAAILAASCTHLQERPSSFDIGPIAIGATSIDLSHFQSTDCVRSGSAALQDCTAVGDDGLSYVFFDGALAKLSAKKGEVSNSVQLPAAVKFDDQIENALREIEYRFAIKFSCVDQQRHKRCASNFVFNSSLGVLYSLELSGDEDGRLVEVVARTDY